MDKREFALQAHRDWKGKIEVVSRAKVTNREELAVAYTPGVAEPCVEIQKDESLAYEYTRKGNLVAVITNGTAVLGLGDIGPAAGIDVKFVQDNQSASKKGVLRGLHFQINYPQDKLVRVVNGETERPV